MNNAGLKHTSFQPPFQAAYFFDKPLVAPKALALDALQEFADFSALALSLSIFFRCLTIMQKRITLGVSPVNWEQI